LIWTPLLRLLGAVGLDAEGFEAATEYLERPPASRCVAG